MAEGKYGLILAIGEPLIEGDLAVTALTDEKMQELANWISQWSGRRVKTFPVDEPLFLLRAQDKLSLPLVQWYAQLLDWLEIRGVSVMLGGPRGLYEHLRKWKEWQQRWHHKVKWPD